jgi:hypothetical protein
LLGSARLFLSHPDRGSKTLEGQLTRFPQGAYDYLVDALSQALNYLREQKEDEAMGWLRAMEEQSGSTGGSGPADGIKVYGAAKLRAQTRARICVC